MKHYFSKGLMLAGVAFYTLPVFAQTTKTNEGEKDRQTIIINRAAGSDDEKTIIEINGDKVTINGKDVKDNKDVQVSIHRIKTGAHGLSIAGNGKDNWAFNFDNEGLSLLTEDANRAMLGVVTDNNDKGAKISSVSKESAAEKAGLKKDDIITKIANKTIENTEDVAEAIRAHKPGEKITISVLRDGKEQKLTAQLSNWKGLNMSVMAPNRIFERVQGAPSVRSATPNRSFIFDSNRSKLGLSIQDTEDGKGVKVLEVEDDGAAAKAGIKANDIITHFNGTEANSADQISKLFRESRDKSSFDVKLLRNGKAQNIQIRIPRKLKTADL